MELDKIYEFTSLMDCYLIDSAFTRTNNIKAEAVGYFFLQIFMKSSTIELWNIILDYDDDEGVFQT